MKLIQTLFQNNKKYIHGKLTIYHHCITPCNTVKEDCKIGKTFVYMTEMPYGNETVESVLKDIALNDWKEYGKRTIDKDRNVIVKVRKKIA